MSRWKEVSLGEVAAINPRYTKGHVDADTPVSFVPMSAVSAETASVEVAETRRYGDVARGYTPFVSGNILVAKITPCFENGKIAQARIPHRIGFGSTEFHVLEPRAEKLDGRYLLHYLRQEHVRRDGERKMTGSGGQRRVPSHFLESLRVPLPSLAEQQRIAEVLDRAEALRAKRRFAVAKLASLLRATFLTEFGEPASNPKGWELRQIGEIGKVTTGNTPPRANSEFYGSEIEWIKSDNINTPNHYLTGAEEYLSAAGKGVARVAPVGSVLVTCIAGSRDCIGNAAIADRDVAFNQQINAIIPRKCTTEFLYTQLLVGKKHIQAASTDAMKGMVSKSRFEQIPLMCPPLSRQREFSRLFRGIQRMVEIQSASLAKLDALFASLQYRAFHGDP